MHSLKKICPKQMPPNAQGLKIHLIAILAANLMIQLLFRFFFCFTVAFFEHSCCPRNIPFLYRQQRNMRKLFSLTGTAHRPLTTGDLLCRNLVQLFLCGRSKLS
ncbi:hypothetical protein MUK42_20293 [Musa troglodytarum]|uniref:Uncharacterized protein n=1 Tax=Musa troglodytarum TaxID=320322 RepID=A0A9E7G1D5_9LILI|nr:hypothetical protein MUK42_20293 [Musa troglodytarum]